MGMERLVLLLAGSGVAAAERRAEGAADGCLGNRLDAAAEAKRVV